MNLPVLLRDGGFNLIFLLGLTFLLCLALPLLQRLTRRSYSIALGLTFGGVAIGTKLVSFAIPESVAGSLSTVAVVAAGAFAGPWGAVIAAVVACVYGIAVDGFAGGDLVSVAVAAALGCGFSLLKRRHDRPLGSVHYLALGLALALSTSAVAMFPAGFADPNRLAREFDAASSVLPVAVIVYPLAVLIVCQVIGREIRRIDERRSLLDANAGLVERTSRNEAAITERKAAEAALAESQSLLRAVVEAVPATINVRDRNGRYVFVNALHAKYHDRPVEWFPGHTPSDIYDDAYVRQMNAVDREVVQSDRPPGFVEFDYVERSGRTSAWLLSCAPIRNAAGEATHIVRVALDITERKRMEAALRESEGRFRTIADSSPALVWMCDETGACIFLNKQWSEYTGRPLEEELGHGYIESIHPDEREHSREVEDKILGTHAHAVDEYRLRGKHGQYRWFLDTMVPRFAPDRTYLGHLGILIDIEDRRKLEEQLRLVQKLEAVGHLTAGIAHDFNNLLTVIIGNLDLIRDHPEDVKHVGQLAGLAFQSAQRGADLVRRMIAFSRQQMLKPRKIDLNRLVAGMIDLLRRSLSANIEIVTRPAEGLWTALADPGQVEEALLNLAINSRDAMSEGGRLVIETGNATLDAEYAAHDSDMTAGDYVMLAVSDTGSGMTPEVAARAVQPFFTTKEVGKGTGLGLSMVYGFVKQSGGHMKIYSEPGHGCVVRLYLPRFVGAADPAGDVPRPGPAHGSETILVVEDDKSVRNYVVDQLRTLGYDILEAGDGPAALALLAAGRRIDLLFTDIMLPGGLLGPQLLEQARARMPQLRALFTSGYSDAAALPGQLNGVAALLLKKPYSRQDLAFQIRAALDAAWP